MGTPRLIGETMWALRLVASRAAVKWEMHRRRPIAKRRADWHRFGDARGCSSMVEQQPSKLNTRVRFPSPAPGLRDFCMRDRTGRDGRSDGRYWSPLASRVRAPRGPYAFAVAAGALNHPRPIGATDSRSPRLPSAGMGEAAEAARHRDPSWAHAAPRRSAVPNKDCGVKKTPSAWVAFPRRRRGRRLNGRGHWPERNANRERALIRAGCVPA